MTLEKDLLELSKQADEIYKFLKENPDMSNEEAMRKCPAFAFAVLAMQHKDPEAELLLEFIKERNKKNGRHDRK